jgi:hypothetical protein
MVEWPGRCRSCGKEITDWAEAGLYDKHWVHRACYAAYWNKARESGHEAPDLRSPLERSTTLELPMLIFLLMFHFGLGGAVAGWIMIDQDQSQTLGAALLVLGIVVPLIGLAGVAVNIISRRRIELVRQALDLQGGWKPGR